MSKTRGLALAIFLTWLCLMGYVWLWSRPKWGVGWALVGTMNLTALALVALLMIPLVSRIARHFRGRP